MRLALIADTFPPLRTSGAIQLRDLSREFAAQGHDLTLMLPSADLGSQRPWKIEELGGVRVLRLRAPKTKDIGYVRRTIAEVSMSFAMLRSLHASPFAGERWDGVIWYSPSIFHGPLVKRLKRESACKGYLIIRDIFPEWAFDMGIMRRGFAYYFFKTVARYQYSMANIIGVQTAGNLKYFERWQKKSGHKLEVLPNWLGKPGDKLCKIRIKDTLLSGRRIIVYAGNMGIAQNLDVVLAAADKLRNRQDLGFLFVGRGSERERLHQKALKLDLDNVAFFDEIDPDEILDLYRQCYAGIVSLDSRHKSHNIPGKFLTYMQCGLPVIASVNPGNDLAAMVREKAVGEVSETGDPRDLAKGIEKLAQTVDTGDIRLRCMRLFAENFSADAVVRSIVGHF